MQSHTAERSPPYLCVFQARLRNPSHIKNTNNKIAQVKLE